MKRSLRILAASAVVVALVGAPVGIAAAAPPVSSVKASTAPDFTPSGNGIRKYMLNVLGSVLGKAMPKKWQAEQIANQYRYNHSWDGIAAATGIRADATPGYLMTTDYYTNPQTAADYELRRMEKQFNGGTNANPMAPPATKPQRLAKALNGVGGALTAVTGFAVGTAFGQGATALFGFDAAGAVCGQDGAAILSVITGTDCSAWALERDYVPNVDIDLTLAFCNTYDRSIFGTMSTAEATAAAAITTGCLPQITLGGKRINSGTLPYEWVAEYSFGTVEAAAPRGITVNYSGEHLVPITTGFYYGNFLMVCKNTTNGTYSVVGNYGGTSTMNKDTLSGTFALQCGTGSMPFSLWASAHYAPDGFAGNRAGQFWRSDDALVVDTDPGNPARLLTCTIEGTDGLTYSAQSAEYREASGEVAAPSCPALPAGVAPVNVGISDNQGNELYNEPVTDEYLDWWTAYPECRTGACALDLKVIGTQASCFDLGEQCADWFASPTKASQYQCTYGMHDVALEECNVYSAVFQPARQAIGAPYSDPLTGDWSGGTNAPTPDRQAMAQGIQSPAVARSCDGLAAMGFDPVAWVMRPIQCALEWAFVPRPAVLDLETEEIKQRWETTPIAALGTAVQGWTLAPTATGCSIPVTLPQVLDGPDFTFNVLDACPGSVMAQIADISKIVTSAGMVVLVVIVLRRQFGAVVDYKP